MNLRLHQLDSKGQAAVAGEGAQVVMLTAPVKMSHFQHLLDAKTALRAQEPAVIVLECAAGMN